MSSGERYNERPAWLDLAHKKLDAAVAAAYSFPADLTDEHILDRLLALNLERATEEEEAAKVKKPKISRAKKENELIRSANRPSAAANAPLTQSTQRPLRIARSQSKVTRFG